ncbi:MAG: DUF5689 domain-containing protein, partial [Tannerella sp.]|nr:DUF5689 domain-containing protein [Tannerella sp.]
TGRWTVAFREPVNWASINKLEGEGNSDLVFSYAQNLGIARKVTLLLNSGDKTQEIAIMQEGIASPAIGFISRKTIVGRDAAPVVMKLVSDQLKYNLNDIQISCMYDDELTEPWIADLRLTADELQFNVLENTLGAARSVRITLTVVDGRDREYSGFTDLSQMVVNTLPFADIRAKIPGATGEYAFTGDTEALEAVVVSESGNMNLETNPQTSFNKIDWTVNDRTAYIQSVDGTYGFRVKTATTGDNTFARYSRVLIGLKGAVLVKESEPERYTLTGLTAQNILSSEAGTASDIADKAKTISQLTDDDLYTFVRLTGTEFSSANRNFVNVNGGYVVKSSWETAGIDGGAYVDCVPTAIRDNDRGTAYVLVNLKAPWCRTPVPAGSGSISGIITHSKLKRYGAGDGYIARYFIRPLDISDIRMNSPAQSRTIVEWNWYGASGECSTVAVPSISNIAPSTGSGLMSCTKTATIGMGANFACIPADLGKAATSNALTFGASWWNTAEDRGEGFVFQFSTAGMSGHSLAVSFAQGGGSGSATTYHVPAYWQIAYSTDGTNYAVLPGSTYGVRPLPLWGADILFTCPGQQDHCFFLPDELLGHSDVYVKLVAASNICGTNAKDGGEGGRITATENTGAVSVRFNSITFTYIPN